MSRAAAPPRVQQAYEEGFRFAVRADIDKFFDEIDHQELTVRLQAFLPDEGLVRQVLAWVTAGVCPGSPSTSPEPAADADAARADPAQVWPPTRGVPTGSPLAPLLGNLFLDEFDERIAAAGGRLVRYADNFLILCRTREEALQLYETARETADGLLLRLNDDPAPIVDWHEPLMFLGYRFERRDRWEYRGPAGPQLISELHWRDASGNKSAQRAAVLLPGESDGQGPIRSATALLGPGLAALELDHGRLLVRYRGEADLRTVAVDQLNALVLLGDVELHRRVLQPLAEAGVSVLLADDSGRVWGTVSGETNLEPQTLLAQVRTAQDANQALVVARQVITAKLANYAALARALPVRQPTPLAEE